MYIYLFICNLEKGLKELLVEYKKSNVNNWKNIKYNNPTRFGFYKNVLTVKIKKSKTVYFCHKKKIYNFVHIYFFAIISWLLKLWLYVFLLVNNCITLKR